MKKIAYRVVCWKMRWTGYRRDLLEANGIAIPFPKLRKPKTQWSERWKNGQNVSIQEVGISNLTVLCIHGMDQNRCRTTVNRMKGYIAHKNIRGENIYVLLEYPHVLPKKS